MSHGFLLVRDVGRDRSWWFSIPSISMFKKDFTKGSLLYITVCVAMVCLVADSMRVYTLVQIDTCTLQVVLVP